MTSTANAMLAKRMVARPWHRARMYSTVGAPEPAGAIPPPRPAARRRAFFPRLLAYVAVGTIVFYAGSVEAAKQNATYRDFFTKRVYAGDSVYKYFTTHQLKDIPADLKQVDLDEQVSKAASHVRDGFHRVSNYLQKNEHVQQTREEVEKRTADLQHKLQEQLEDLRAKAGKESAHLYEQAQTMAGDAREHLGSLAGRLTDTGEKVGADIKDAAKQIGHDVTPAAAFVPRAARSGDDLSTSYDDRKLVAGDNRGRLRDDPSAPRLPQLASSVKKLGSSEPVISQLAGTIDELAAFVKEAPHAGELARGVLESAQADLSSLCQRLDEIKASDAQKLSAQLEKQAQAFEAELKKASEKASSELSQRDSDWSKKVSALQDEQARQFKTYLQKELEVQSEIIDRRLKDEVIARGIELQRKWSQEIKSKVEHERAGRLGKLNELTKELHGIEGMLFENAHTLDDSFDLNALHAALRELRTTIDGHGGDDSPYVRRTFAPELATLRSLGKVKKSDIMTEAVHAIERTGTATDGVESVPTLHEWFRARVAPRLTQVALLPEHGAGVLSYIVSSVLSPLLFARQGNVPGSDVSSIVARAEWLLERRDLDTATRELNQLRGWAKMLASDWLEAARKRLEVDQALALIEQEASFASLLHT